MNVQQNQSRTFLGRSKYSKYKGSRKSVPAYCRNGRRAFLPEKEQVQAFRGPLVE